MKSNVAVYEFSSRTIASCNLDAFLKVYAYHKLPVGSELRALLGKMIFTLERYNEERRQLYLIPEVRRFCVAFHQMWPYWLFFCDLEQDDLKAMTFGCLPSVSGMQVEGQSNGALAYDRRQLDRFLQGDVPSFEDLCQRAGIRRRAAARRLEAVRAYFEVPFRPMETF